MLPFLESNVLGMWNDAVFPSLSSPLSSSFAAGNADPWLLSSNTSPEIERLNCGNFFSTLQDACSDRSQLQSLISPPLGPNTGFTTGQSSGGCYTKNTIPESNGAGDGGPVMATACSAARAQPKVSVAERRKRLIDRDPANKYQKTSPPSKRPKSTVPSQKQHRLPQDEATIAGTPLVKAPVRRSQKLGDKITSLQQLVSPFGKTDTASVLHEAALSIKFLHEQIRMLTAPYFAMVPSEKLVQGHAETRIDLQSTGLCLVPLSTMGGLMDGKAYDSRWPETMAMETDLNFY